MQRRLPLESLPRASRRAQVSWALYDLSNNAYIAVALTFFLSLHVINLTGGIKWFTIVNTLGLLAAALALPVLGLVCDRTGNSKRYLVVTTYACIAATALFATTNFVPFILLLFFFANLAYQTSILFYNSLLPGLIARRREGLLSGIGISLAYVGTILTLLASKQVLGDDGDPDQYRWTFLVGAGIFLVFSVPLVLWVPERTVARPRPLEPGAIAEEFRNLLRLLAELPRHRALMLFLAGNFLLTDVLHTCIYCFAPYVKKVFQVPDAVWIGQMAIPLQITALLAGFSVGWLSDRFPAKYPLVGSALLIAAAILTAGLMTEPEDFRIVRWVIVLCGGTGLAGIWAAGRKCLIDLAPPDRIGSYFGLFVLTQKVSIIGFVLFGFLADEVGYEAAILSQLALLAPGLALVVMFRYPQRTWMAPAP